ncbi:MAG TPA: hypothetical protein VFI42_08905 [Thermomicrobiaceae bacterium]|nr:hypothetical protein [Thermomicrobiaceae bacterium]
MPWWRFGRAREPESAREPAGRLPVVEERGGIAPVVREAERRSLKRLLERRRNLAYDIAQSETAFLPSNRWSERLAELDDAIQQAEADLAALRPEPGATPPLQLAEQPIEIVEVSPREPAAVRLRVGEAAFRYREEVDWAERGHQLVLPQLALTEGDVERLIPSETQGAERARLANHLENGLSIVANEALERAVDGEPPPAVTLAELARPCPACGGWRDVKGRCPACAALAWRRDEIREALVRLIKERDDVGRDLSRARDRLPVFRRQLADVEQDIEKLQAKGVEPR